jgi:hypothetical protein
MAPAPVGTPKKISLMIYIRRDSIDTSARDVQFRPSARIGIPISSYQ